MAGRSFLSWLLHFIGIVCVSLAAKITKKAAVKVHYDNPKGGNVCTSNNAGQWINEPKRHFLYECTGSKK